MFWQILQLLQRLSLLFRLHLSYGSFPRTLSAAEEREAFVRLKLGDRAARDLLISHNLRLVSHVAKKYHAGRHEPDDRVSIGSIGLIKAVDSFDPAQGTRFSTYAARCIGNEILMSLRAAKKQKREISLYSAIGADSEGNEITLADVMGTEEGEVARYVEQGVDMEKAFDAVKRCLSSREQTVIVLRYGLTGHPCMPQREVAALLGISRSYVSRIEKKALQKMAEHMA